MFGNGNDLRKNILLLSASTKANQGHEWVALHRTPLTIRIRHTSFPLPRVLESAHSQYQGRTQQ